MTKRPLNDQEKTLTLKAIEDAENQLKHSQYNLKVDTIYLTEGLELNYKAKKKELENKVKQTTKEIEELNNLLKIWKDQVVLGVEIKENTNPEPKLEGENN